MFSHVFIGVTDFDKALSLYRDVLGCLGIEERFCDVARPWAGWQSEGAARPLFLIGAPFNQESHDSGNGQMVAFLASNRALVRRAYEVALQHGCKSEGAPGLRPQYHRDYYGAYFRDLDGNKICIVCHEPEP